ncbi:HAD-IA family hydrolase [Sinorhizobium meliloti]|uniref:HAD-IA family hydrolase n=1 Tax=Rhizobium meliloti TaxID=382 RepID=A0AAW9TIF2_RHIML|nr:HAD-IA family hydrolase [Sinorhizobium meliloti]MQW32696.1 HAD-IA family hydrolase [Sinorhizobium meliloti]
MEENYVRLNCKAVLFDMDGVLVDSLLQIEQSLRQWASKHSLDADHVVELSHGRRDQDLVQMAAPFLDVKKEVRLFQEHEVNEAHKSRAKRGAVELVKSLQPNTWAVVTSGCRAVAEARLKAAGIKTPAVLVSADDVSVGKPDPEGYLSAAHQIGVSPANCVVFEDAPAGVKAARDGGMQVVGVGGTVANQYLDCAYTVSGLNDVTIVNTESYIELHLRLTGS